MAISINVSENAAKPPRQRGDIPQGWYVLRFVDVELQESKSEKNPGKPMYNFELEITDDERNPQNADGASEFAGRPEWIRACLWTGAEFTIVAIMRALGHEIKPGALQIPDITDPNCPLGGIDAFVGKDIMARWGVKKKEAALAAKEGRKADPEWLSFKTASEDAGEQAPAGFDGVKRGGLGSRRRTLA